jgi:hypothetical protein
VQAAIGIAQLDQGLDHRGHGHFASARGIAIVHLDRHAEPGFWQRLLASGAGNDLAGPLVLGLRLVMAVFETAVPAEVLGTLDAQAAPHWRRRWWPAVYAQAMRPENDEEAGMAAALLRQGPAGGGRWREWSELHLWWLCGSGLL